MRISLCTEVTVKAVAAAEGHEVMTLKECNAMKNVNTWLCGSLVAGFLSIGASAPAQQAGLVNVNVSGITVVLADLLDVEENQIPVTVQAPIGIAANVCNVGANVLAQEIRENGVGDCDAEQTSDAFNNLILRQID